MDMDQTTLLDIGRTTISIEDDIVPVNYCSILTEAKHRCTQP